MKRLTSLILAFTLLLALAACKNSAAESSPPVSPEPSETVSASPEPSADPEGFTFTRDSFPRLDGSTSTAPLGRAVASALLGETEDEVSDLISFSRTTNSFRALMAGQSDLLIVGEPNASVYDEMEEAGFEASIDTFATDGLIFVVNEDNPVDNLTTEQIRAIYSGEITNWSQVGGDDLPITPFQRNEDAGSQALMKKLVMGDTELMDAPAGYIADSMMGLMEAVRSYDNSPGAIGYSVYYYANDMKMASGLKILSVDGVAPSAGTIRSEEYPHRNAYYVVMAAGTPEDSPTAQLYRWLLSEEGQQLVADQGYVSVLDLSSSAERDVSTIAHRLSDGPLPEFIPSEGYEAILPYVGSEQSIPVYYTDDEYNYDTHLLYGLCTTDGLILTDPVYNSVFLAGYHDSSTDTSHDLPIYILTQTRQDENGDYYSAMGLAAADGSWYTGMIYESALGSYIFASAAGVLMKLNDETAVMVGADGRELFRWTVDDFLPADHDYRQWFFDDGLNWVLRNVGELLYYSPTSLGLDGPEYIWIDPFTGKFLDDPELGEYEEHITEDGRTYFDGGWCQHSGTTLKIRYDDGAEKTFQVESGLRGYATASKHHFLFHDNNGGAYIYDHDGTLVAQAADGENLNFATDPATGEDYLFLRSYIYENETVVRCHYTILNPDGSEHFSFESDNSWLHVYHGLVSVADDTSYRLMDLSTGEDLIRLPRWNSLDHPAE